jgi:hypothetical protein
MFNDIGERERERERKREKTMSGGQSEIDKVTNCMKEIYGETAIKVKKKK